MTIPNTDRMREEFEQHAHYNLSVNLMADWKDTLFEMWQAADRARAKRDAEICRQMNYATSSFQCADAIEKDAGI